MPNPSSNSSSDLSNTSNSSASNSSPSSSSKTQSTGNVASTLRDAADRFTTQINKADPKQIMSDASGAVSGFYSDASLWLSENREVVTYVGIGLVAGLMGFFLGRGASQAMEE